MKLFAAKVGQRAGALFVCLALASGGLYYLNVQNAQDKNDCQARYNKAFSESLSIRSKSSTARQDAADAVIAGVGFLILHPPKTEADQKKAAAEYVRLFTDFDKASKANEEARAANPLPELPDC